MLIYVATTEGDVRTQYTAPFFRDYCRRHGYALVFGTMTGNQREHCSWQRLLAYRFADADFILTMDADLVPLPHAPPLHDVLRFDRINVLHNRTSRSGLKTLDQRGFVPERMQYNTALLGYPRGCAPFLERIYYHGHLDSELWREQGDVNLAIAEQDVSVHVLDECWNQRVEREFVPTDLSQQTFCVHLLGNQRRRDHHRRALWNHFYGAGHGIKSLQPVETVEAENGKEEQAINIDTTSQPDFTTVVALDRSHLNELRLSWPTWRENRPELLQHPLLLFCDADVSDKEWDRDLAFLDHPQMTRVTWSQPGVSQREKMLTALVKGPAEWVKTPWYLKLDTDTVALERRPWIDPTWFTPSEEGRLPAFISSPWGYTKPPEAIATLDDWGDTVDELRQFPRLDLVPDKEAASVSHPRIISWCFFGSTEWTRRATALCPRRLPVPSQDTFLWYVAARRGDFYRRVSMKQFGWGHFSRRQSLQAACRRALEKPQVPVARNGRGSKSVRAKSGHGIAYLVTGPSHAVRCVVSLSSLRQHYDGPVTVFTSHPQSHLLGRRMAADQCLQVEHRQIREVRYRKNSAFLLKLAMLRDAPFEITTYLDADTLVAGDISPLVNLKDDEQMVATQFADWQSTTSRIRGRIEQWYDIKQNRYSARDWKQLIETALQPYPAVNGGVFTIRRDSKLIERWEELALIGRDTFICDEVALQIILPHFPHQVLDCRWNCSPIYGTRRDDARIWHMHGEKHLKPHALPLWWPAYATCLQQNVAQIQEWTPAGDKRLAKYCATIPKTPLREVVP